MLSSFQCYEDEKGPWSDKGYDESVIASGLNLVKHHHWSAEVRGSPDWRRSVNSASFWTLPDGFNNIGVLASVWPMAGLSIWAISNRVGGNTFFMVAILIIGIAFAISNMIASRVAHEDDQEIELGALAPLHQALMKTYEAVCCCLLLPQISLNTVIDTNTHTNVSESYLLDSRIPRKVCV